jgi:hypothetical protein
VKNWCFIVEAKNDGSRDKKERCMYEDLHRKITSAEFLLDLGLVCEALQELHELSLDLEKHDMYFNRASKNIENIVKIFKERKKCHQPHYENAIKAAKSLSPSKELPSTEKNVQNDPLISPNAFYENLKILQQRDC